jgi:hypothetical protein
MKHIITGIITSITLFTACSHYKRPESFSDKMNRFQAKNLGENVVPNFPVLTYKNQTKTVGRAPASIAIEDGKSDERYQTYSTKGLYFLSLYWQFQELKNYSSIDISAPKSCPHFHTALLNNQIQFNGDKKTPKSFNNISSMSWDKPEAINNRPEFFLPTAAYTSKSTVIEQITKSPIDAEKITQAAINLHATKMRSELNELCEYGTSDNYYAFESLINYAKDQKGLTSNERSIQAMFKTTILSNYALLNSLNTVGRAPASIAESEQKHLLNKILTNLNAPWFNEYLTQYR